MPSDEHPITVYLEAGESRTFAAAVDWPGWCRSGRDEASALQTLVDYAPRYERALAGADLPFHTPTAVSDLLVVERVTGNASTDFGAPNMPFTGDSEPVTREELERWQAILNTCWKTFDASVQAAEGQLLRKGPRGGGRDLPKITEHVRDVNRSYLRNLGVSLSIGRDASLTESLGVIRQGILDALPPAVRGELPKHGPRGGVRWLPRYFVRRLAWHELDHAWEIEDRVQTA